MSIELLISEALQLKERDIFDGKTCKTSLKIPFILDWIALQVREVRLKCFLCLSRVKVLSPALALPCCQGNSSSPCHALSDPCMFTVLWPPWPDCRPYQPGSLASSLVQDRSHALSCLICTLGKVQALELMQLEVSVELFLVRQRLIFFPVNSCLICMPNFPLIFKRAEGAFVLTCLVSCLL